MSQDVQWSIMRRNSCHIVQSGKFRFSKEPNNLLNKHSRKFSGSIPRKTIGITPHSEGGVILTLKKPKYSRKPKKMFTRIRLNKNRRAVYKSIRRIMKSRFYRTRLTELAVRRACVLLTSQNPKFLEKVNKRKRKVK